MQNPSQSEFHGVSSHHPPQSYGSFMEFHPPTHPQTWFVHLEINSSVYTIHSPNFTRSRRRMIWPSGRCGKVRDEAFWPGKIPTGKSFQSLISIVGGWTNPSQKYLPQIGSNFPIGMKKQIYIYMYIYIYTYILETTIQICTVIDFQFDFRFIFEATLGYFPFGNPRGEVGDFVSIQMLCLERCYVLPCPYIHTWEYILILVPIPRCVWRIPKEGPLPSEWTDLQFSSTNLSMCNAELSGQKWNISETQIILKYPKRRPVWITLAGFRYPTIFCGFRSIWSPKFALWVLVAGCLVSKNHRKPWCNNWKGQKMLDEVKRRVFHSKSFQTSCYSRWRK